MNNNMLEKLDAQSKNFLNKMHINCKKLKHKKIAIYGIGAYTGYFLELYEEFNVIGLLDKEKDNVGKKIFGLPIITLDYAIQSADAILIISYTEMYWQIIYERISNQIQGRIPVFFPNGKEARTQLEEKNMDHPYWRKSEQDLMSLIKSHEVISFDIFDTILMRKVSQPSDIWKIIQRYNEKEHLWEGNFFEERQKAMVQISIDNPFYNLEELYFQFQKNTDCDDKIRNDFFQLELECEKNFIVPRHNMNIILKQTLMMGKRVYLISDMYLSSDFIRELLKNNDLPDDLPIWISCERKALKADGKLWEQYKAELGNLSALHIGDNMDADIKWAEDFGIKTFHVYSSYQLLLQSDMRTILSNIVTVEDSIVLGVILAKYFNSPFALQKTHGRVKMENLHQLGYIIFGNLVYSFLQWVNQKCEEDNIKQILFFSRDSYLPYMTYKKMNYKCTPIYFFTSRMFVMILNVYDWSDMVELLNVPFKGTWGQFLYYRFGVVCNLKDSKADREIDVINQKELLVSWLKDYEVSILEYAEKQRQWYKKYMGLFNLEKGKTAILDVGYSGSNQYFLERYAKEKYKGYYLHALVTPENEYCVENQMRGLYQDDFIEVCGVTRFTQIVEAVFTSPDGMFLGFDENGNMLFDKLNRNQETYEKKIEIHEGINEFIKEIEQLTARWMRNNDLVTAELGDVLIKWCFSNNEKLSPEIKNCFYIDNAYIGMKERKILE